MKRTRRIILSMWVLLAFCLFGYAQQPDSEKKIVVAYVTSWSKIMPDAKMMTHINYAFGHVNDTFDGVRVDNPERLKQIVALKKDNPELKVLISIGGWGSGRFSEMAAGEKSRKSFAKDCQRVVKEFKLDGVDIDWEYPTSSAAKISSSPQDTENYTLLMRDIRKAIGKKKLLTLASAASAKFIDFPSILPYINFVNIMTYDMANAPKHQSSLFRSKISGRRTGEESVKAHLDAGLSLDMLVFGMPFYGRGNNKEFPINYDFNEKGYSKEYTEQWDDVAKVPYLVDKDGKMVMGLENTRSLAVKCQYIWDAGLLGGMYWEYSDDNEQGDFRRTLYENLMLKRPKGKK